MSVPAGNLRCLTRSRQAILVTTGNYTGVSARLETLQKVSEVWEPAFPPTRAVIGKNGFAYSKVEGDGKTPIGVYSLGTVFGRGENPGTRLPYRQTTANDFWVDDPGSALYNTWQVGPARGRWDTAEPLYAYYPYAVVINYNTRERISGMGSAVFLHVWDEPGEGTSGCVALSQQRLLEIIRWLDPAKNPLLVMGPVFEVARW
ncbi:MAG: L,D-transpeptidase family protein [Firmicutes bacterium]|nr:L,D-transpeptidase family protein [Bacillota bacterium]